MSISYNKKYKGQILRQDKDPKKLEEEEEKELFTPKKNSTNSKNLYSNQVELKPQQGQKTKVKSSQYKQSQDYRLNGEIKQEDQDDYQEQNKASKAKKISSEIKNIRQNNKKTIPKTQNITKKQNELEDSSQEQNKSDMTTESNNRNRNKYPQSKRINTVEPLSKSNSRSINKLPNKLQQQHPNSKNFGPNPTQSKYIFYNNNKTVSGKPILKEQKGMQSEESDNEFMNKMSQAPKLSKFNYKKHAHSKGEDKKQRLKNKLGFIFDLANQDQLASVSYYSQSDSLRETPLIQPVPKKQTKKAENKNDNEFESKPKQGNFQKIPKQKQNVKQVKPSVAIDKDTKQKSKQKSKSFKTMKQQQYEFVSKIKQQKAQDKNQRNWQQNTKNEDKLTKLNKFEIQLQKVNIEKPLRIYETPKRQEERKITSIETIKKEPILTYQSTYKEINPQRNNTTYQDNKDSQVDEELMTIIKKNDQYLGNFKIQKYPKNYFQSPRKNTPGNQKSNMAPQNRRIKTELDHRNEDFSPLSEQQRATLARLKARQQLLLKKIKYQFYHNPSILYNNDSSIQEESTQHKYQDTHKAKQFAPSSNTYEISRVLPLLSQTFKPKKSEVLQHYPLSLKSYQKPNYLNNQFYRQNQNSQIQTQKSLQNNTQEVKYNRGKSNKSSNLKDLYLFSSRNDKDYKIRNPKQKYQRIKRLLQRV